MLIRARCQRGRQRPPCRAKSLAVTTPSLLLAPRDVRLGGVWSKRQRAKNDALWWAACAALGVARLFPDASLRFAGRGLGAIAHAFAASARRTALANVARVYPAWTELERAALVRRSFLALGEALGESARALAGSPRPRAALPVTPEALLTLREARARGRGVVFVSAHVGPWERVAEGLVAAGIPLVAMARESYDPRFSRLIERARAHAGVRVIWRGHPSAPFRIVRALRRGDVLGVPMDLRSRVESRPVPFLGHPAPTPIGPARIALRVGAPVVVGTAAPTLAGDVAVTATPIPTSDLGDGEAAALELTARINAELSRRIVAFPSAWVWMHDRWADDSAV
jgi:KDO2-lipid IV(A) lauroyltransferase